VRERRVDPAGDDRGERRLRAAVAHLGLELEGHLALGPPGQPTRGHALEDLVRERRRLADAVELARLLHGPHALDQLPRRHELHVLPHEPLEPLEALDAQLVVLEPDTSRQPLGRLLEQVLLAARALEPLHLPLGLHDVPEVRQEHAQLRAHDADAVRARIAGQVADVRQIGDEEGVEPVLAQQRLEPVGAAHDPPPSSARRISSASR
jgi:hypothetical protein